MAENVTRVVLNTRLDPGVQLNDTYEIDERIASGGMGEVYRGHNIQTGEPVAIKTILPELADQEAIFALFKKEATVLGRLHHDTIVRYYSFSRDPRLGRPYLAMEFVDGVSLADRIKSTPLTPAEARRLFVSVADGLAIAHAAGVVHRDLSPDNIILRGGDVSRPKIIDFGIARAANIGEGTLIGGGFAGKYNFISPEQLGIHNREVDGRSDIYSLGLVIAASLRGRPLDMGGSHVDVIEKRSHLPDLSDIDPEIRPLVEAMLQPDPDARPASAAVIAEWLRASVPGEMTAAQAGFGGGAGAPAINWGTHPPAQKTGPVVRTGTPFAEAVAPQKTAATSSGESPFGSAAAYPAGQPAGRPAGAAETTAPAKAGSGAGRYALAAVLLLLVAGGGGYWAGLFGPQKEGAAEVPPAAETAAGPGTGATGDAAGGQTQADAVTAGSDGGQIAGRPDQSASGIEAESAAAASDASQPAAIEQSAAGQNAAQPDQAAHGSPPASGSPASATPPASSGQPPGGQAAATSDTASQASAPAAAGTESSAVPAQTGTEPAGQSPAQGGAPSGPAAGKPVEADEETKVAAAGITRMADLGMSWLRSYDGGDCFFAAVTSVSNDRIDIKGFGPDQPVFQRFYDSFVNANGFEPEVNGHLIDRAQCAAANFLKTVQPGARGNPEIVLPSARVKLGESLSVTVEKLAGRTLNLLMIDSDGLVTSVTDPAGERGTDSRTYSVTIKGKIDKESPEMVIALTSPSGLQVPGTEEASRLFPKLERQIQALGGQVGVDFDYFKLSP